MHLFIEKGMRGGISYVAKRYAKANNPYIKRSRTFTSLISTRTTFMGGL